MRSRGTLSSRHEQRLDELGFVWNALDDQWEQSFSSLVDFVETNGRARPSQAFVDPAGLKLGSWVTLQRKLFYEGRLDSNRQSRLEALEGWVWNPIESEERERWEAAFALAKDYLLDNDGGGIPTDCRAGDGFWLGSWVSTQRKRFWDGNLDQDRTRRLEALPGWVWDRNTARWEEGFRHATEYAEVHGSIACPTNHVTDCGFRLGNWVGHQRKKGRENRLSEQELARLSSLPGWASERQDPWEIGYANLLEYQRVRGHVAVGYKDRTSVGYPIGQWVSTQRQYFKLKKFLPDRIRRLEKLDGWLWYVAPAQKSKKVHVEQWEKMFACLEEYVREHGTALVDVAKLSDANRSLGAWVTTQRVRYKDGKLGKNCVERLEKLEGWNWAPQSNKWESALMKFIAYVEVHKHGMVPALYKDEEGFSLGSWVRSQRKRYQDGRMPQDRVGKLESVPEWSWKGPRSS